MVHFNALIERFGSQGEKTGWTYILIPEEIALKLKPGNKKAFRVKGALDSYAFEGISLLPMGGGDFIMALNAAIRKQLGKTKGAMVDVTMDTDDSAVTLCPELMECLQDEPVAFAYFNKLPPSHQQYYSKWIESAKTDETKAKRIAQAVTACSRQQGYSQMMRSLKADKNQLLG